MISDDGSSDDTLEIVHSIIDSSKASGIDYIFLSDQDDIWRPNKVEQIISVFESQPDLQCVFHDVTRIDKNDLPMEEQNPSIYKEGRLTQKEFLASSVSMPLTAGMTMCISRNLLNIAIPFPQVNCLHDHWLMFCALCWRLLLC